MTQIIIISILGFVIVLLVIQLIRIENRFEKLFYGTNAKNLEDIIHANHKNINTLQNRQKEVIEEIKVINNRLGKSIRSIETLRFNPFSENIGGNQSFAISLLNDEGDGVILSSLYARDRMSIFAKPIQKGNAMHDLTEEEQEVLHKSKNKNGEK